MSGETSKSKSPDKPRKRASAVDLSFGNVLDDLENDSVLGPSVEPDPLFPALGLPEPIPDVFINVSRDEKRKVESPDTSKHRRCSSDTFLELLKQLAGQDKQAQTEDLLKGKGKRRRPTADEIMQDDILNLLQSKVGYNRPYRYNFEEDSLDGNTSSDGVGVEGEGQQQPTTSRHAERLAYIDGEGENLDNEGVRVKVQDEDDRGKGKQQQGKRRKNKRSFSHDDNMPETSTRNRGLSLVDEKKAKRILANRISAQKSRTRKLQFVGNLESTVSQLYKEVSILSPQLDVAKQQREHLQFINEQLKKQVKHIERRLSE